MRPGRWVWLLLACACAPPTEAITMPEVQGARALVLAVERIEGDGTVSVASVEAAPVEAQRLEADSLLVPADAARFRFRLTALHYADALEMLGIRAGPLYPAEGGRALPPALAVHLRTLSGADSGTWSEGQVSVELARFRF